jgi:hypothetical protein
MHRVRLLTDKHWHEQIERIYEGAGQLGSPFDEQNSTRVIKNFYRLMRSHLGSSARSYHKLGACSAALTSIVSKTRSDHVPTSHNIMIHSASVSLVM